MVKNDPINWGKVAKYGIKYGLKYGVPALSAAFGDESK